MMMIRDGDDDDDDDNNNNNNLRLDLIVDQIRK